MRSFRAKNISQFVKALLDCELASAQGAIQQLAGRYSLAVTRDQEQAKRWIGLWARGTERYGVIASSKARPLKPNTIDIRVVVNPVHLFLNGKEDSRSSFYLEDAATQFQVRALALDWSCVAWDGDLRFTGSGWSFHSFRGDRWCKVARPDNHRYLRNAYRVLLTRARQGMVLYVPACNAAAPTRAPNYYDATYHYLTELGMPQLA